jgi:hypothetical protein
MHSIMDVATVARSCFKTMHMKWWCTCSCGCIDARQTPGVLQSLQLSWSSVRNLAMCTKSSTLFISLARCSMSPKTGTLKFRNWSMPSWLHPKSWSITSMDIGWWSSPVFRLETSSRIRTLTDALSNRRWNYAPTPWSSRVVQLLSP